MLFYCDNGKKVKRKWQIFIIIRFSLRCLKYDVIPVSVKLKTNIRTSRGLEIIRKTERQLLNECIRSINNKKEAYFYQLRQKLDENTMDECKNFMNRVVEARHQIGPSKVKI